jgi:HEAT repeats
MTKQIVRIVVTAVLATAAAGTAHALELEQESRRLIRAKDYIAEEQWLRAIEELRVAVADTKETRRDEALYWLAHSLNHSGDPAASVETIRRLEREYPSSIWVKPAQSLRIEIAVRLNRSDVLWWTALPRPATPVRSKPGPGGRRTPKSPAEAVTPEPAPAPGEKLPPQPPKIWYSEAFSPDVDLRIQALGGLMKTEADKAIPVLREIALESDNPGSAVRAIIWLAQSELPQARATVVHMVKNGPEPLRAAAVKQLGRFGGPEVSKDLLQVYPTAKDPVKLQIVQVLGDNSERVALLNIVQSEKEGPLRYKAMVCLGQAGGVEPLAAMYKSATFNGKRAIIAGQFIGRGEAQLIRIAEAERDRVLREEVINSLRLLGTPKAKEYLQKVAEKR